MANKFIPALASANLHTNEELPLPAILKFDGKIGAQRNQTRISYEYANCHSHEKRDGITRILEKRVGKLRTNIYQRRIPIKKFKPKDRIFFVEGAIALVWNGVNSATTMPVNISDFFEHVEVQIMKTNNRIRIVYGKRWRHTIFTFIVFTCIEYVIGEYKRRVYETLKPAKTNKRI